MILGQSSGIFKCQPTGVQSETSASPSAVLAPLILPLAVMPLVRLGPLVLFQLRATFCT